MARFKPVKDLDAKVARKFVAPFIDEIAKEVQAKAKDKAPALKTWNSQKDGRVRDTHRAGSVDGQVRPANLRFSLKSMDWDMGIGRSAEKGGVNIVGPRTYFREPRDHGGDGAPGNVDIAYVNHTGCRCFVTTDPDGLRRHIERDAATVTGAKVKATVHITAEGAVEAHEGDTYWLGTRYNNRTEEGVKYMEEAAREVARKRSHRST